MSGTLNSIYNNTSYALNLNADAMGVLEEQVSTGSRINRASDDPSNAYQVLRLNSQQKSLEDYMNNISDMSSTLGASSSTIDEMVKAISGQGGVNESLTQILSGTYNEAERKTIAGKINDTLEQMVSLANTQNVGQYIFGGSNTSSAPYAVQRTNGEITSVTYQGGSQQRNVEVAPGVQASAYYAGEDTFCSNDRGTPKFLGDTGAAVGSGTSSVKGNVWLTVTKDSNNHYNLSIDGGPAVDVSTVSDPSNVAVTNSNGQVLYVDATNINSTGVNMVIVPGTCDVFNTLITARDLLENKQGFSDSQLSVFRGGLSDSVDEVNNLLVGKQASIGSKIVFLDNLKNSLDNTNNNTKDRTTTLQQADVAQLSIDIARRQTLYQMALAVAGKLLSTSLLDYI
ncbi:MAG: flagellar hook-associated protein FlgL [Sedimentisphaerales bacterium]